MTSFADSIRQSDPDRYMAALFAPKAIRDRLFVLYAFYQEIARIPESVSEPVIGEMRLNWAREAVEDLFSSPPKIRNHKLYRALSELIQSPGGPDRPMLMDLIESRVADLGEGPFPNEEERERYIDKTAITLMRAAVRLCVEDELSEVDETIVKVAGRAWGYAGLVSAAPALIRMRRPPLTEKEVEDAGAESITIKKLQSLISKACEASTKLKALPAVRSEIFPAIGYVCQVSSMLKRWNRADSPEVLSDTSPLIFKQVRLVKASLTGRV